jgi:hypothetical protein
LRIELDDAQKRHQQHPTTFEVPTQEELNNISVSDHVKVCDGMERFWVKVTGGLGRFITGTIANDLISDNDYNFGTEIEFEHKHVYSIMKSEDEQTYDPEKAHKEMKSVIESYLGRSVESIDICPDPENPFIFAFRTNINDSDPVYFIFDNSQGRISEDLLEEVSFDQWPPVSDPKNMYSLDKMVLSKL